MATRAVVNQVNLITRKFLVPTSKTTTKGLAVIFSGADDQVEKAGADDDTAIGVALDTCVAGDYCEVALFGYAIVEVTCGTGGTTRGKKQVLVTDGFTDAPADNGATTPKPTYGIAMQTASAADKFGLLLCPANRTTT